jgi:hypothetical protein
MRACVTHANTHACPRAETQRASDCGRTHRHTLIHTPTRWLGMPRLHRRATLLHLAAIFGKYDVVALLVANGADASAQDKSGFVEYSRRRCTFGVVIISEHRPRGRVRSDDSIIVGCLRRAPLVAHSIGRLYAGRTRRGRHAPTPIVEACRRRRETPRDKAKDKGAFDAAVKVRPPLLIGTSSAALGTHLRCEGCGPTSP